MFLLLCEYALPTMISPINTQHDLINTKARIPGFKMDLIMIFLREVGHPCCPSTYRQGDIAVSIDSWHFTLPPFSKERVSILKLLGCNVYPPLAQVSSSGG